MSMNNLNTIILLILLRTIFCIGLFDVNFSHKESNNGQRIIFTDQELREALSHAEQSVERLKRLENVISRSRIKIRNDSISFGQLLDNLPNENSKEYDRLAQIVLKTSTYLLNTHCLRLGVSNVQCAKELSKYSIPDSDILDQCKSYQHNNAKRGVNIYRRLLPAYYGDGLYKLPHDHSPLPKNISDSLFNLSRQDVLEANVKVNNEGVLDRTKNVGLVQWAQFIEHDLVQTVVHTMSNNKPIECCDSDYTNAPPRYLHPACDPLKVVNDTSYICCLNYVRSAIGQNTNCKLGPAEQLNQATNSLDLSQLYGTSEELTNTLRTFKNGELAYSDDQFYPNLPKTSENHNYCIVNSTDNVCYKSGDSRVNLNPYVTTLYTIFLRSHNQIARSLQKAKKSWKDDKIFHKARAINAAIYNKIIYEEWLPVVLGQDVADEINFEQFLNVNRNGAVSNEFATAGIRFYYSMMPGDLYMKRQIGSVVQANTILKNETTEVLQIKNEFYNPRDLGKNMELDRIMSAILNQNAMAMDTGYVGDITRFMYKFRHRLHPDIGTDILALDINRGRDHGLSKYVNYLEICTDSKVEKWSDLEPYINEKELSRLKLVYDDISKIDLIVGALAEKPKEGATVGPTFSCIIGEQFSNTRRTAPHFYTRESESKLYGIVAQYSAARLICDSTQLEQVPKNIFFKASESNPMINCLNFEQLPKLAIYS